jgi:6-phosphogluconolactonase
VLLALSGGSTPLPVYERLAKLALPWPSLHLFWGDERCVPPDDQNSNYGNALRKFISQAPIPEANVHRIQGELEPQEAAKAYEDELRRFFGPEPPVMDLVLLGMGADGHTASLFPGCPELAESSRWAISSQPPAGTGPALPRVTLTLPVINAARAVLFLVAGEDKRPAVSSILRVLGNGSQLPAGLVRPAGELAWFLDRKAAPGLG